MSARAARQTGVAGLASFALIVAASLPAPLWNAPGTSASGAEVLAYNRANRGEAIASLLVYSLAMGLFMVFAAGVWTRLKRNAPDGPLSAAFAVGAVAL